MKKTLLIGALAVAAVASQAQTFLDGPEFSSSAILANTYTIGTPEGGRRAMVPDATIYSNTTTFSGQGYANGGAAVQSGNTITRMVADDLNYSSWAVGKVFSKFTFSVANFDTAAVSARARVRFYLDNGSGLPGNYFTGFTFNPITFNAGSVGTYIADIAANNIVLTSNKLWAAITFDNNTGATGATAAQLNNLGQGIFNPPTVGSSTDVFFQTTSAGSFVANNPAGSLFNFNGNPPANFGWALTAVPEPATMAALGLGVAALIRRRKKA